MSFAKEGKRALSGVSVLLVMQDQDQRQVIRQMLAGLGFSSLMTASTHSVGLGRLKEREVSLVCFQAASTTISAFEFLQKALELRPRTRLIALSWEPRIDDVFGMLRSGVSGFCVMPLAPDILEQELERAQFGPPLVPEILNSQNRNQALAGMALNDLAKISYEADRLKRTGPERIRELFQGFRDSVELAKTFCEGGQDILRQQIIEDCIRHGERPSSKLGRVRKNLEKKRLEKLAKHNRSEEAETLWKKITGAKSADEIQALASQAVPLLMDALQGISVTEKVQATKVLAKLASPEGVKELCKALEDKEDIVRINSARALGAVGALASSAVPRLRVMLKDTNFMIRLTAATTLGEIGSPARAAVPELIELLSDWNKDVRRHTALALGNLGLHARAAIVPLLELLNDEEADVRNATADALGSLKAAEAVVSLTRLLSDGDESVRKSAVTGLRKIGTPAAIAVLRRFEQATTTI